MKKSISWLVVLSMLLSILSISGITIPAATTYYRDGDMNGDGSVTTYDARLLLSQIVSGTELSTAQKSAADLNNDGNINTSDVKLILDMVMNGDVGTLSEVDLLAPSLDSWNNPVQQVGVYFCTVREEEVSSGGYTFASEIETDECAGVNPYAWPYTSYSYDAKVLAPRDAIIEYDVTVSCDSASINLYLGGDIPHFDDANDPTYLQLNSFISTNLDSESSDLKPGTYTGTVSVGDLIDSGYVPSSCLVSGHLWISGIKLYVVGYTQSELTIRKLKLTQAYQDDPELTLNADPMEVIRNDLISSSETEGLTTLTGMELYVNGERSSASTMTSSNDNKKIYHTQNVDRVFNYADGYKIDIPYDWKPDYSLSALRSRYESDTCVLNISKEEENPYASTAAGWDTYLTEWLNPYISDANFLSENYMRYQRDPIVSETMLSGYTVMTYDIAIDWQGDIAMPYYSIAVIREFYNYDTFYLMVLKSAAPTVGMIDRLIRSFEEITVQGTAVNSQGQYSRLTPSYWNDETKAYYNKLCTQDTTDWGFFSASMIESGNPDYDTQYEKITSEYDRLSTAIGQEYDIIPTYTHLSYGSNLNPFPLDMATELAGGNGFNGKPVLQFTYQYTMTNNSSLSGPTPVFNVLRGDYDAHFRQLAQDIKSYGQPVLFRLNNEMNTDWTSYCGIVSLLDPDIFVLGWQRLYDIFEEEGVDNCIWIFNPFTPTAPYCSWGETLCYMPGEEYVQILGLTNYEMGNGTTVSSFKSMYTEVYDNSKDYFLNYPWVISEFACGAGGEKQYNYSTETYNNTTLGRNRYLQSNWITGMFDCLNNRSSNAFCKNIKGAVWFNCNDYVYINESEYILNYLALDENATYSLNAFKNGLAAGG